MKINPSVKIIAGVVATLIIALVVFSLNRKAPLDSSKQTPDKASAKFVQDFSQILKTKTKENQAGDEKEETETVKTDTVNESAPAAGNGTPHSEEGTKSTAASSVASSVKPAKEVMNIFVDAFKNFDINTIIAHSSGAVREKFERLQQEVPNPPKELIDLMASAEILSSEHVNDNEFRFTIGYYIAPLETRDSLQFIVRKGDAGWLIVEGEGF